MGKFLSNFLLALALFLTSYSASFGFTWTGSNLDCNNNSCSDSWEIEGTIQNIDPNDTDYASGKRGEIQFSTIESTLFGDFTFVNNEVTLSTMTDTPCGPNVTSYAVDTSSPVSIQSVFWGDMTLST